jgi:hypothetical protein
VAILDLQRREMEAGRIRFGNRVGNRPNRLDHPLVTSPDRALVEAIAAAHNSEVTPWPGGEGQWQTEVDELQILIPVSPEPFSQFWERWSGGGCMRRCDGFHDQIQDAPCDCDKDSEKRACSATTRIAVLTPYTGDARLRIETKSINAAVELPAALEKAVGERTGEVIPAVLSVEQRNGKKGKVPVPVIRITKVPGDMVSPGSGDGGGHLDSARTVPAQSGASVSAPEAGVGHAPVVQVESPEPVVGSGLGDSPDTRAGAAPSPETSDVAAAQPSKTITQKQIGQMMATAREHNVSEDDLKTLVMDIAKVPSRKLIPADRFLTVIEAIKNWGTWQAELAPERQEDVG